MSDKRIIYPNDDGGVSVIIPSDNCGLSVEDIARKDSLLARHIKSLTYAYVPSDRSFHNKPTRRADMPIGLDMSKAKDIHRDNVRVAHSLC